VRRGEILAAMIRSTVAMRDHVTTGKYAVVGYMPTNPPTKKSIAKLKAHAEPAARRTAPMVRNFTMRF
jgi:hypothetical protein